MPQCLCGQTPAPHPKKRKVKIAVAIFPNHLRRPFCAAVIPHQKRQSQRLGTKKPVPCFLAPHLLPIKKVIQNNGTKTPAPAQEKAYKNCCRNFFQIINTALFAPPLPYGKFPHPAQLPVGWGSGKAGNSQRPFFPCKNQKSKAPKTAQKPRHPAPGKHRPLPAKKAPRGVTRNKPAQGSATFTNSEVPRRAGGGQYSPSPSPQGFPHRKKKRRGLLPAQVPVANPFL